MGKGHSKDSVSFRENQVSFHVTNESGKSYKAKKCEEIETTTAAGDDSRSRAIAYWELMKNQSSKTEALARQLLRAANEGEKTYGQPFDDLSPDTSSWPTFDSALLVEICNWCKTLEDVVVAVGNDAEVNFKGDAMDLIGYLCHALNSLQEAVMGTVRVMEIPTTGSKTIAFSMADADRKWQHFVGKSGIEEKELKKYRDVSLLQFVSEAVTLIDIEIKFMCGKL